MILLGSGFTATRGTQPPEVPTPWFSASAKDATSRPRPAASPTASQNLIVAPENFIVPPPYPTRLRLHWTSSTEELPPFRVSRVLLVAAVPGSVSAVRASGRTRRRPRSP